MSAFQYYSKMTLSEDRRKRKNKKKPKSTMELKKPKVENGVVDSINSIGDNVLNNIYNLNLKNSTEMGQKLLEWLIHPISLDNFMK